VYAGAGRSCPYRLLRAYAYGTLPAAEFKPRKKIWLDGIGVAVTREYESADKGLYLAFKGGHNAESHNHNDVGSFIVFSDGEPTLIDLGVGEYTRKTFSPDRYTISSMRSDHHHLPSFNGFCQKAGRAYEARNYLYNEANGGLEIDVTGAYPEEAGLESYTRHAVLDEGKITVTDKFTLKEGGNAVFHLITREEPKSLSQNSFEINGRKIIFDESLGFSYEEINCESVELRSLPTAWKTDKLWRVMLELDKIEANKEIVLSTVVE
jgi:hypothetical protein